MLFIGIQKLIVHKSNSTNILNFWLAPSGVDVNNMVATESNGDGVLGPVSGEMWPAELDTVVGNPSSLNLEEKDGLGAVDEGEDTNTSGERLEEDHLVEQLLKEKHNCDRLSPQSQLEGTESDPAMLETLFIAPLDGSQAELRGRVIKEVRRPGRSKYKLELYITWD